MDPRAVLRMHPERSRPDRAHEILASGLLPPRLRRRDDGVPQPYVIPLTYQFDRRTGVLILAWRGKEPRDGSLGDGSSGMRDGDASRWPGVCEDGAPPLHELPERVVFGRGGWSKIRRGRRRFSRDDYALLADRVAGRDYSAPPEGT